MSARFEIKKTPIAGATVIERKPLGDSRGFLERLYCDADLEPLLGERRIRQINRTLTEKRGTVRGMHFQTGTSAETKIVSCLRGRVLDVTVDLRKDSPTYLSWYGVILDGTEHTSFILAEGLAHGFQALTDDCEMLYFHTAAYDAAAEAGVNPLDPAIAIDWPLAIAEMSDRDGNHPLIDTTSESP